MQPDIHLNYWAILAATAASVVIGFLWYGPLFSKAWIKEMGIAPDSKPAPGSMRRGMILMVIGAFLTAYVLAHTVEIWRPSTWKVGADSPNAVYGFASAFFTWIGFYVPVLLSSVAWESRSWKLFGINAGYYFTSLLAAAMILAFWR